MEKVLTNESWKQIFTILPGNKPKFAAIAYVSSGCPIEFTKDDILICDASERSIKTGTTDAKKLRQFFNNGVELFSLENLHAKIMICEQYSVVGSSNLSESSEQDLYEGTLISDSETIRSQLLGLFYSFKNEAEKITSEKLTQLEKIEVIRQVGFNKKQKHIKEIGNKIWILNATLKDKFPEEESGHVKNGLKIAADKIGVKEKEINWIRFTGKTSFRLKAKPGDMVIEILKSKKSDKAYVFMPLPVIYRQDIKHWTRFYFESSENIKKMSWEKFEKTIQEFGLKKITKSSNREISETEYKKIKNIWND